MVNLRVAVAAQDREQERVLTGILEFAGVNVSDLETAQVILVGDGEGFVDDKKPIIYVGGEAPRHLNVVAEVPQLRYHQLISALHEAQTILRDDQGESSGLPSLPTLVGDSPAMIGLRSMLHRATQVSAPILMLGEKGCGKEQIARIIHERSERSEGPFVPIDCGVIPEELIESELFGHERGAFPGALTTKVGRLELARTGTIYLANVDALNYPMQVKLLRALHDGTFERIGSDDRVELDVRVVAASESDLEEMVASGGFREDLYYKLSVFPVQLTALRMRTEDLPAVIERILADIEQAQKISLRLSMDVIESLKSYAWPGNVRELTNVLERLSFQYAQDVVTTRDLPARLSGKAGVEPVSENVQSASQDATPENVRLPVNGLDLKDYLARLECSLIEQALDDTGSVVARAADRLHIRRTTLVEKMRKYGISRA